MGLANFYRRFVKRFAAIAKPLTDLTKKAIEFKWEATEEAAFEALKKALMTAPILQVFDKEKPHEVWLMRQTMQLVPLWCNPATMGRPGCRWSTCHTGCR